MTFTTRVPYPQQALLARAPTSASGRYVSAFTAPLPPRALVALFGEYHDLGQALAELGHVVLNLAPIHGAALPPGSPRANAAWVEAVPLGGRRELLSQVLDDADRLLVPGGRLHVRAPRPPGPSLPAAWSGPEPVGWLDEGDLRVAAARAGFLHISVSGQLEPGSGRSWLHLSARRA